MKPLTPAIVLAATLAAASAALAQHTRIICEASGDYGVTWHDTLTVWPGQRVDVRVRFELLDVPPGVAVLGFSGATYQPVLAHWSQTKGDTHVPFTFPGLDNTCAPTSESAYTGRHITQIPGMTGRVAPFGASGQSLSSSTGLLTRFFDSPDSLRFAGSKNSTPTTNIYWGVASAQAPPSLAWTIFVSSTNVTVFRYAVTLGSLTTSQRQLVASVPRSLIASGTVKWYSNSSGNSTLSVTIRDEDIIPATILVRERCAGDLAGGTLPNPRGPNFLDIPGPDGSVNLDDILFFLEQFEKGLLTIDLDNGTGEGVQDQAVTIDDLLFFLAHFESGC